MQKLEQFYINGEWVAPEGSETLEVENPATMESIATIAMGTEADVDKAVKAAKNAFVSFSQTSREERVALIGKIIATYEAHYAEVGKIITDEMGAPISFSMAAQAGSGMGHLATVMEALKKYQFEENMGTTTVFKEAIGVCALITPWNWPINQVMAKLAPALAAGCTVVLKPSEIAPLSAYKLAEILDEAGVPAGVFNLVNGDGPTVGTALSSHPDVDMVSFTGSTRAGIEVAKNAAPTVKRVTQELGGKSANIILDDADFESAVKAGIGMCCGNSGQSCMLPTRMLVPENKMDEVAQYAKEAAESVVVGDPQAETTTMGPVVSKMQFDKIQHYIQRGIEQGATLVTGGPGKPAGLEQGHFVKPTVFANVSNEMDIARDEIFGPVVCIIGYKDEEDAIRIANDTNYGLSGAVSSGDLSRARRVAAKMRTGMVHINSAQIDFNAPFGGYKQSGNGREWGAQGIEEYLETKSVMGYNEA